MKVLLQRVKGASVEVDGTTVGLIKEGLLVLVGFTHQDSLETVKKMVPKVLQCRIFEDPQGVMNESVVDQQKAILSISQFTLYADTQKGNRPSYIEAARPEHAEPLYAAFNQLLSQEVYLQTGRFGAEMHIHAELDGPVTIELQKN